MIRTRQGSETLRLLACSKLASIYEAVMGPAAVGTAIGAATVTVGRGALSAVGSGLSFLAQLASATSGEKPEQAADQTSAALAAIKRRTDELRQRIQRQLAAFGISLTKSVELVSDGQGGINVAGSHPQQAAIEAAVGSDILLERDFSELARDYRNFGEENGPSDLPQSLVIAIAG